MLLLVVYFNSSPSKDQEIKKPEPKKSENELQWEDIRNNMSRPLRLCDLDFTDLQPEDDANDLVPGIGGGKIPPPPPMHGPPPPMMMKPIPPPSNLFSTPYFNEKTNGQKTGDINGNSTHSIQKNKKTVRSIDARCTRTNTSTKYSTIHIPGQIVLERSAWRFDPSFGWQNHLGWIAWSKYRHREAGAFIRIEGKRFDDKGKFIQANNKVSAQCMLIGKRYRAVSTEQSWFSYCLPINAR